jgi:predicted RNA-binding Zn-ribbon protein involved in translation (DUF1610 family)
MSKSFIAINLDQFHSNQQKDDAWTTAQIRFISADNIEKAKEFVETFYPTVAWAVIPKTTIDKNIVYKSNVAKYQCQACGKYITDDEGTTTLSGAWVCDNDTCRILDEDNNSIEKRLDYMVKSVY